MILRLLTGSLYSRKIATKLLLCINNKIYNVKFDCIYRRQFSSWVPFTSNENVFAHNIMARLHDGYIIAKNNMINIKQLSQSDVLEFLCSQDLNNSTEALENFTILSKYACNENVDITSNMFASIFEKIIFFLPQYSDEQIEKILKSLIDWPVIEPVKNENVLLFCKSLDSIIIKRLNLWNIKKILLFADYIYASKLSRHFKYTNFAVEALARNETTLTAPQLVQTLFYVSFCRSQPANIINLEKRLNQLIDSLTIDELSICCMGFFKSKTKIKDERLINSILKKINLEAETVNDITLSAILKLIRYSEQKRNIQLIFLLDSLTSQIPRLSFLACVHIALAGTTSLVVHRESLTAVENRFIKSPLSARLKDLERLSFALSTYQSENTTKISEIIVNQLRNPDKEFEINRYKTCLPNCLSYLAINNVYPEDLINRVLHEDFVNRSYGGALHQGRALMVLDTSVDIECKNYKGNRLNANIKQLIAPAIAEDLPVASSNRQLNFNQKIMEDVIMLVKRIRGGKEYMHIGYILPHFSRADIVITNDKNGRPIKVNESFPEAIPGSIIYPPNSSSKWIAIVVTGRHCFTSNTNEMLATTSMKLRQLKKIGYTPAVVSWIEWKHLKTDKNKIEYLKHIIKCAII